MLAKLFDTTSSPNSVNASDVVKAAISDLGPSGLFYAICTVVAHFWGQLDPQNAAIMAAGMTWLADLARR